MAEFNKDLLKDPDKCLEEFARYVQELEGFRKAYKQAAMEKEDGKRFFELERAALLTDNQTVAEIKLLPNKEDREAELNRLLAEKFGEEWADYTNAESLLAGYDKAFQVIDVQRSIVQSAIKIHERKR